MRHDSQRLAEVLTRYGLPPGGGCELFQWARTARALEIHEALARQGILTRHFGAVPSLRFGLPATPQDWERVEAALGSPQLRRGDGVTAKTLMVQGTTSDAGKSTVVTGLCRVLKRRGFRVAPFKPQNMALNSAVTVDGGEIGRAQALQAQAAGVQPTTDMNPILLKPNTDMGAQVIVHGRAVGNMPAAEYHKYKSVARQAVLESHARLAARYEVIVTEGAGSPAEINLREGDIANMGFAEAIDCPVILVADIERGGVFAHLVGTVALLSASEQARIAGFVINRFRGDVSLLEPGLRWLERYTGKPVLGVLPYLHGLSLDAEDAISRERSSAGDRALRARVGAPTGSEGRADESSFRYCRGSVITPTSILCDTIRRSTCGMWDLGRRRRRPTWSFCRARRVFGRTWTGCGATGGRNTWSGICVMAVR